MPLQHCSFDANIMEMRTELPQKEGKVKRNLISGVRRNHFPSSPEQEGSAQKLVIMMYRCTRAAITYAVWYSCCFHAQ